MNASILTREGEKRPIVYRTDKGPIASNVSPSCRLDQGDTAQRFCKSYPVFHEVYHDKIGEPARFLLENHLTLG